jgi:hypothetical protein
MTISYCDRDEDLEPVRHDTRFGDFNGATRKLVEDTSDAYLEWLQNELGQYSQHLEAPPALTL